MTQRQDTPVRRLVEDLMTEEGGDTIRLLLERMMNRLLEAEQAEHLQALPYERTEGRQGFRNGYRTRQMVTRLGQLTLRVPRTRDGEFSTGMFRRFQRSERALQLGLVEMYVHGVSTRKVTEVTETLFGTEVSATTISNLSKELDEEIAAWRERPLEEAYPYLVVDAQYHKVREGGRVVSRGVLTAVGVSETGHRRLLDFDVANGESELSWTELFRRLRRRGLKGVILVVSDDHSGLKAAVTRCFDGARWQRCQFHFMQNVLKPVRKRDQAEVADLLRWVYEARDEEDARERLAGVVEQMRERWPETAEKLELEGEQSVAVYDLPRPHHRRLRTTNGLERFHEELRRRSRVVRIYPNREALARLMGALIIEQDERWLSDRRYLNMTLLGEQLEKETGEEKEAA